MNSREHLALALDVATLDEALALAEPLREFFAVAKIGLELHAGEGARAVEGIQALGYDVFLDVKLHDIPTTVQRAARVHGRLGVRYLNFHAAGGVDMLRAGIEGLREGARERGHAPPKALAVTVLTSDADTSAFDERLDAAAKAGCDGVVCSTREIAIVKARYPDLLAVVPGIRLADSRADDQVRVGTPAQARQLGADLLVIGRTVTAAADRHAAAARVVDDLNGA